MNAIVDIITAREGWAVGEQANDILSGMEPLSEQNPNALKLIARQFRSLVREGMDPRGDLADWADDIERYLAAEDLPMNDASRHMAAVNEAVAALLQAYGMLQYEIVCLIPRVNEPYRSTLQRAYDASRVTKATYDATLAQISAALARPDEVAP